VRAIFEIVLRRILVLLCATALMQETNLGSLLLGAECIETCPDDTSSGHCSPICATCSCGTHANPVTPRATRIPAPVRLDGQQLTDAVVSPATIHLPEIPHIPKRFVA
jgi:hypothetical protein